MINDDQRGQQREFYFGFATPLTKPQRHKERTKTAQWLQEVFNLVLTVPVKSKKIVILGNDAEIEVLWEESSQNMRP